MNILVLSGKGGAGKSMFTSSFYLFLKEKNKNFLLIDADVDAPDSWIWLGLDKYKVIKKLKTTKRVKLKKFKSEKMLKGIKECPHNALKLEKGVIKYNPILCEGCGLCSILNPDYFEMYDVYNGEIRDYGIIVGHLYPGFSGSGKIVSEVIEYGKKLGRNLLIDGAPGTGCPVNAALKECDKVILIVEESKSGYEDFLKILNLVKHFGKEFLIVINKHGLNKDIFNEIKNYKEYVGFIPYDKKIFECAINRKAVYKCKKELIIDVLEEIERRFDI